MEEHEHEWDLYTDFDDRIRVRCECGADEDWSILKQQLAQAREDAKKYADAMFDMKDVIGMEEQAIFRLKEENATMRALLLPIGTRVPERHGEPICIYCYEILSEGATLGHKDDCLWLKIRAFLAQHKEGIPDDS